MSGRWIWRGRPQALVRLGWDTSCGAPGSWDAQLLGSLWHHGIARAGWYRERRRRRGRVGGGRESWEEGLTESLQQAQSSGVAQKRAGGRAGEHWAPGRSSLPQSLASRGGWKLAQGLGDRQGLSQTPKGQRRGGKAGIMLPVPFPCLRLTPPIGTILPSPTEPRPHLRSSAQPPPATPDSAGLRHLVIQLPALVWNLRSVF